MALLAPVTTKATAGELAICILGTGAYEPARVVTSAELDAQCERPAGLSLARSGVASRRWAAEEESSSAMAAAAVSAALKEAELAVDDLDAVIVSAVVPEQPMPTTAVLTLARLGVADGRCEAFDINASCVGFLTGLGIASAHIATGRWRRVAVVASEVASKGLNHSTVETSALFGDGAAAAIVGPTPAGLDSAVLASRTHVWPQVSQACRIEAGGTRWNATTPPKDPSAYLFQMDGFALLHATAQYLPGFLAELQEASGLALADIDVVVPHQASGVGLRYLRERVGVRPESIVDILSDHGNQVSASIPTALHAAVGSGQLKRGQTALLLASGAGLTLSGTMVRY